MDTAKGELSFSLNGANFGVAYEGIPLDKPLIPCVILWWPDDSVEFNTSGVKENVDSSIPTPFNVTTKSATWNSITLTWDAIKGASFYQIEVDESRFWEYSTESKREIEKLSAILKGVADEVGALFFDAATVAGPGSDQLHMTAESHERLASALYEVIKEYFESREVRN